MRIQTFSVVCGTAACNARCPFCVSKMTVEQGVGPTPQPVNWRNFDVAARLARESGCLTAMITGKGEPTLFPKLVDDYVRRCGVLGFPMIELQTNGIPIWDHRDDPDWYDPSYRAAHPTDHLRYWYRHGLTTVALSVVHHDPEVNRKIYVPYRHAYVDLPGLIGLLREVGFSVRLAVVGIKDGVDDWEDMLEMVDFAKEHGVAQLTWRPVNAPAVSRSDASSTWQTVNAVPTENQWRIQNKLANALEATALLNTPHGMTVYDVAGQSLAITNSLTQPVGQEVRQLIAFPDGRVSFDWAHEGARIL